VDEFASLISLAVHEMRTPASVIAGYLRMLLSDPSAPLSERQQRMATEAERACARLVEMLSELSDLGKMDAGTAVLKEDRFDLFELVAAVVDGPLEPLDREIGLRFRGATTGGSFIGDRVRVRAMLSVVVRAVIREQPASTTVIVDNARVTHDGRPSARIVVSPEPDVIRASASLPSDLDDRRGGLGLGLPLARRVVARYGGHIWSPEEPDGETLAIGRRGAIVILLPLEH
jgi:signal transduction histidine kinase